MFKRSICTILACLMLCSCIPLSTLAEELDNQEYIDETAPVETAHEVSEPEETVPEATEPVDSEMEELLSEEISIQTPSANSVIASGSCGENLTWSLNEAGKMTISGFGPMDDYADGTAPWFDHAASIISLTVEEGVTSIGAYAFCRSSALQEVYIPTTMVKFGYCAFWICGSVTKLYIEDLAAWCSITFDGPQSTPVGHSSSMDYANIYINGELVKDLVIPMGVTEISDYAFYRIGGLKSVTFSSSVTKIGKQAFASCFSLSSFDIPESVVEIGKSAISTDSLKAIRINGSGKLFHDSAIACGNLKEVHIDSIKNWLSHTFETEKANPTYFAKGLYLNGAEVTEITAPENTPRINDYAFINCSKLTRVTVGKGAESIGEYAFTNCSQLEEVVLPDSVNQIGACAFEECKKLVSVTLPRHLAEIKARTFYNCGELTNLTLPEDLAIIGSGAFYYCNNLRIPSFPESIQRIEYYAFFRCSLGVVNLPHSIPEIDEDAFYDAYALFCYWDNLDEWKAAIGGSYSRINWYCIPTGEQGSYRGNYGSCDWTLKDGVLTVNGQGYLSIYDEACGWTKYNRLIEKVIMSDDILSLNDGAFSGCTLLTEVKLPAKLTTLYTNTFRGCTSLKEVKLPDSLETIGNGLFGGCISLEKVNIPKKLEVMTINMFEGCVSLKELTIPANIKVIESSIFSGCINLASIRFLGDMPEFTLYTHSPCTFEEWSGFVLYPSGNKTWKKDTINLIESLCIYYPDKNANVIFIAHDGTNAPQVRAENDDITGAPVLIWNWIDTVDCYEIYRATSKSGTYKLVDSIYSIAWIDETAVFGKTYYYKIKGICDADSSQNTAFSAVKTLTYRCGVPLVYLDWDHTTGKMKFTWDKVDNAKKYEIYRSTSADGKFTKLTTTTKTSYIDSSAAVGKEYYYKIRAVASSSKANSDYVVAYGYAICGAPTLRISYNSNGKPVLSWNRVSGAEDYVVYRRKLNSDSYEEIYTTSNTSYTDTSAKVDTGYYYAVQTLHEYYELDSYLSTEVYGAATYSKPTLVALGNTKSKPTLSWSSVSGAVGYNIYRSASETGTYELVGTSYTTRFTDTSATGGKNYYYKATTLGNYSESPMSGSVCIPCPVDTPVVTGKAGTTGKPVISWSKITNAKKYVIWRSTDGVNFTKYATTTSTSYTDSKATGGQYTYCVVALGSKGIYDSDFSNDVSCYVTCATPNLTAKIDASTGKPALSWGKISGATGYAIYRSENGGEFTQLTTTTATSYADSDTKSDNQYSYKIVALGKEEVTNSPESAAKTVTVTVGKPKTKGTINDNGKPVITWDAVEDAVTYKVYRSTSSSKSYKEIATVTDLTYVDTSVSAGKTYYYKVMAVGENSKGAQSAYVKLTGKCDIPTLNVEAGTTGKPVLTWNKISGAKKYEIWRSVDGAAFKKLTTVTKTTYTDTKATEGAQCTYKVKALGSKSSYNGLFSEELSCYVTCAVPTVTVNVDAATGKPSLSWKKVTGATGYEIYRTMNSSNQVMRIIVQELSFVDETAEIGVVYTYTVKALGKAEVYNSAPSKAATVTATCGQTKVTGKIGETGKPELTWTEVEGATTYVVYRSTSSSKNFKKIASDIESTSYADITAKKGKTYYYRVVAVADGVTGAQSSSTGKLKAKK